MSDQNGPSALVVSLLMIPVIILVNAVDFKDVPSFIPHQQITYATDAYESVAYTEPKAALTDENLKAAFPSFVTEPSELSRDSKTRYEPLNLQHSDYRSLNSEATWSVSKIDNLYQPEKQSYIGTPGCGENGSCYGDLNAYGAPKEVFVEGYYRGDGTYVRSHYRSRPNK